jgi:hypothetical protein
MNSKLKIDTRVRTLKAYLEDIELGKIQIPSFQRDFLWAQDDIKQLFDSIKNNYPIGSIQFWKPLEEANVWIDETKPSYIGPYKIKKINKLKIEPIYILDGYQRLSSLFGCLTNPEKYNRNFLEINEKLWNDKFNIYYDLDEEKFIYLRQKTKNQSYQVPVYVFMNSVDFRQYSRKYFDNNIIDESTIELYLDRADAIGQIFTNYQIASVDINYASIEEAVEIFWRINAKGLEISKDWIVSALTSNKGDFRLGTEIDKLLSELKPYNFEKINRDVIFQCIQNSFGKIYFDYKIEDLVKRSDFIDVTRSTIKAIKKTVRFFYEDLLVLNSKLIPYNNQVIFITSFFNSMGDNEATDKQLLTLKNWFWITTYSNYFTIYSLSGQRKAFEQFLYFIEDDTNNPVYNDKGDEVKFSALEFPERINMKSVRAKALALFMINFSMGIKEISLQKVDVNSILDFDFGNLFSCPKKDNPAENFVPVIDQLIEINGNIMRKSISNSKRPKDYSFLLQEVNENLFISKDMIDKYDGSEISEKEVLKLRKERIIQEESIFVQNCLKIEYL